MAIAHDPDIKDELVEDGRLHLGLDLRNHLPPFRHSVAYATKDSGERMEFETGSRRDSEAGKLDYTLIPWKSLRRYVELLERGAQKYDRHNWRKGQSMARIERSLARHLVQYLSGERDEDHLAAVVFNAVALMDHEDRIAAGELPKSLDDREVL